jgi:hypothetical protein
MIAIIGTPMHLSIAVSARPDDHGNVRRQSTALAADCAVHNFAHAEPNRVDFAAFNTLRDNSARYGLSRKRARRAVDAASRSEAAVQIPDAQVSHDREQEGIE